jgi:hypothetical protein
MKRFENGHRISERGKVPGAGKPRGPEPTTATLTPFCQAFSRRFHGSSRQNRRRTAQAFRMATGSPFMPADAVLFRIGFLRADPAAYGGQGFCLPDDVIGFLRVSLLDFLMKSGIATLTGQPFIHGLFLQFKHLCASSTALLLRIAERHFLKIFYSGPRAPALASAFFCPTY